MIKASVLGATGYSGIELLRLLEGHPQVSLAHAASRSYAGKRIRDVYPNFMRSATVFEPMDWEKIADGADIVFAALPHGLSQEAVAALYSKGGRVIDLSGDFRYDDKSVYEQWYGLQHAYPQLLEEKVYGLTELYRERIRQARLVANPGCYTTCGILPLYPLLADGLVKPGGIVIDAKSGVSGAGRKDSLGYSFCETDENFKAYGIGTHRHTSEIEQELSKAAGAPVTLSFTPHLLPVKRGILATIYADLQGRPGRKDILRSYGRYAGEPFVQVYPEGLPELKHVNGSNHCAIGFAIDERLRRIVVVSALDNLIKGAAGQAIQNMNLLCGFEETTGLPQTAWYL